MTPAEEGAYIRLLCHCWGDPECSIPDDDDELAILSRLGELWFKGSSAKLRRCFEPHPELAGRLINVRLQKERTKQANWRSKCAEGGKKSGQSRRNAPAEQPLKSSSRVVELNGNSSASAKTSVSSSRKERGSTSRKTGAPDLFPVTDDMKAFAAENAPGIDVHRETGKFLDHHRARGNTFIDWLAAWRNWIHKATEFGGHQDGTRNSSNSSAGLRRKSGVRKPTPVVG